MPTTISRVVDHQDGTKKLRQESVHTSMLHFWQATVSASAIALR